MMSRLSRLQILALALLLAASAHADLAPPPGPAVHPLVLPGATDGVNIGMDYLGYDPAGDRVWIPAGALGEVDVIDAGTETISRVPGFPTKSVDRRDQKGKRTVGPSSVTLGGGFAYVGNRADSSVCAVDAIKLQRAGCVTLDSSPDGLAYVAATHEVWATTPRDSSITFLDVSKPGAPVVKGKLTLPGKPEDTPSTTSAACSSPTSRTRIRPSPSTSPSARSAPPGRPAAARTAAAASPWTPRPTSSSSPAPTAWRPSTPPTRASRSASSPPGRAWTTSTT